MAITPPPNVNAEAWEGASNAVAVCKAGNVTAGQVLATAALAKAIAELTKAIEQHMAIERQRLRAR
ncbi:hypothetical protein GCM10027294_25550 [Marinactinospora endophytica]